MGVGFGERLREERKRTGLNQADFAKAGGVHRNSQTEYETGKTPPNADYLSAVAELGVDVRYLLTGVRTTASLTASEAEVLSVARDLNDDEVRALVSFVRSILDRGKPKARR